MTPTEGVAFLDEWAADRNAVVEQLAAAQRQLGEDPDGFWFTEDGRMCVIRRGCYPGGERVEFVIHAEGARLHIGAVRDRHCVLL